MEDHEQTTEERPVMRIHPKKSEVLLVSIIFLGSIVILTIGRWNILHKKQYFMTFSFLVCCILVYVNLFRRVSVDSRKLRYYVLGIIPVEIYWYEVAQIGIVRFPNRGSTSLMGEMFAIVLKPCKNMKKGIKSFTTCIPVPSGDIRFL